MNFNAMFERLFGRRIDYLGLKSGQVVYQREDGTVDVRFDDKRIPDCNAPIRYGAPGVEVKVVQGTRVLVAFENGSPSAPVVIGWPAANVTSMTLGGDAAAARPVAREQDVVAVFLPPAIPITGTVAGIGPIPPGTIMTITTPLVGMIVGASGKVKA